MPGFRNAINPQELAYCRYCNYPMLYIYDQGVRKYCHECLVEISMEAAKKIVGDARK